MRSKKEPFGSFFVLTFNLENKGVLCITGEWVLIIGIFKEGRALMKKLIFISIIVLTILFLDFPLLAQSLIGWPGIIASFVFSVIGCIRKRYMWLVLGAVFALPISLYLGATPGFKYFMAFLPLFQLCSAYAVHKRVKWLSWVLLVPFVGTMIWLANVVVTQ